jgi:hypothetical protein
MLKEEIVVLRKQMHSFSKYGGMPSGLEWSDFIWGNGYFETPVVLKVAHDNNKKIVLQLFKILRSSTRASALKIVIF